MLEIEAVSAIHEKLKALQPTAVRIEDESHLHVGHKEAGNGAHLRLEIVSDHFMDLAPLQRHRAVYDALGPLAELGVHALSLTTLTPQESNE
jgi:BolA protein